MIVLNSPMPYYPKRQLRLPNPCFVALAAALSTCSTPVLAQARAEVADSVVITGSLRSLRTLEAPYAINVIDAENLRAAGPMLNLSEALARVPGLVVANRSNYAQDLQISSRGFGARAGFGVRGLRLYSDGIPASMPDGQGQVAHFDLAGAQRIEVLRGPFSSLYGNSSGGVIALFSAPVREAQAEVALDAGSFDLLQARMSLATPLGGGWDMRASGSNTELNGFRPQSAAHRTLGNLRLGWQGESDRVTLALSDHTQSADDPLGLSHAQWRADARQTASQATQFDTRKTIRQTQMGGTWRHAFGGANGLREFNLTGYAGTRGVTQWLAIAAATQANARHGGGVIDFDRRYQGANAQLLWQWGDTELATGLNAEGQHDARRGYENFTGAGINQVLGVTGRLRREEQNRADTREAFAQLRSALTSTLDISAGLRSGRVAMSTRDAFLSNGDDSGTLSYRYTNPVLGLRWMAAPQWSVHASAARGFESPSLGELAYRPDGSAGFNSALQGQTSRQFELGSKWRSQGLSLDAAVFDIRTANEIGVQTNSGGRSTFQNVGATKRSGLELGVATQVLAALRVQASASWLQAQYSDGFKTCAAIPCLAANVVIPAGNRISGTQRASGFAEVAWRPSPTLGEVGLEWRTVAATVANDLNTEQAPGYAVWNLRWSGKLNLGGGDVIEALARVDNLADRHYVGSVIVNDGNGRFYEPASPRSLLLSLRWLRRW